MSIMPDLAFEAAATAMKYAPTGGNMDTEFDLDRVVWDPEYRRRVIDLLAGQCSESGDAESPG